MRAFVFCEPFFGLDDECLESFCKAEGRANELDRCSAALCTCRDACRQVCRVRGAGWWLVRARDTTPNNSTTALRDEQRLLYQLSPLHFPPPATSLLNDEGMCMCIHNKRWDASRPAALTLRSTIMVADWCLRRLRLHLTLHQDDSQSLALLSCACSSVRGKFVGGREHNLQHVQEQVERR